MIIFCWQLPDAVATDFNHGVQDSEPQASCSMPAFRKQTAKYTVASKLNLKGSKLYISHLLQIKSFSLQELKSFLDTGRAVAQLCIPPHSPPISTVFSTVLHAC